MLKILIIVILINIANFSFGSNQIDCFPADTCHQIGVALYSQGKYIESIKYSKQAAKLRSKNKDSLLWKSYRNIGKAYYNINFYNEAKKYYDKAYEIKGNKKAKDSLNIIHLLGVCYYELGDLERALDCGNKAISISNESYEAPIGYTLIARTLAASDDSVQLHQALQNIDKAIRLSYNQSDYLLYLLIEKGNILNKLKKIDQANEIYKKTYNTYLEKEDTTRASAALSNIATVMFYKKNYKLAINTLNQALNFLRENTGKKYYYRYALLHENLADNYLALQKFDTALIYYQKALINLTNNFRNEDIFQNPHPKDTTLFVYSIPYILQALHLKASAAFQYYNKNNNVQYLNLSNQTYQTAFDFHDKLQKEISTENSRLFQVKNIMPYLENALKVAYELQERGQDIGEAAFRFIEKNKATVLQQSINEVEALQFAGLPGNLLEQEKDLKIAIAYHNKQKNDAIENEDTLEIERLRKILFKEEPQYDQLINNFEENYPDYYQLKHKQNTGSLANIQNLLNDKKAILEYFVGDSNIYVLVIQKNKNKLFKIEKPESWNSIISTFRSTIKAEEVIKDEYTQELYVKFTQSAAQLYKILLEDPLNDFDDNITYLQIIPDGKLNYIPFGLLLTNDDFGDNVDYKNLPYLVKEKNISYVYAASLLIENKTNEEQNYKYNYAGFAPDYTDYIEYQPLNSTKQLIHVLSELFSGIPFIDDVATETIFDQNVSQFKTFQLAMHGILDNNNPLCTKLIFTDGELEANELYNMKIPAQLGVLSACKTGVGKEAKGEGIMSLSRAFTYAGCNSLVMSLWSIEDNATAEIVEDFFKYLKKGKAKDEALRQAKLDYLQNPETGIEFTHPIYWAGLVQSGDTSSINFGGYYCYWLILISTILLLIITWLYLKKGQRIGH